MLKKRKRRRSMMIDITPLIDVMFLLLIFFMIASSFHEETRVLEITLPRAENPSVITIDVKVLNITVMKDNRIFIEEDEVMPEKLPEELLYQLKKRGFHHVLIRADVDASYRSIITVIDAANRVGTDGISFAVSYTPM